MRLIMASFEELREKLDRARGRYQDALEAQTEALRQSDQELDPDSSARLRLATQSVKLALERYTEALDNFTAHVLKRT